MEWMGDDDEWMSAVDEEDAMEKDGVPAVDPQARPGSADSGVSVTSPAAAAREETAEQARDKSKVMAELLVEHLPEFFGAQDGDTVEMLGALGSVWDLLVKNLRYTDAVRYGNHHHRFHHFALGDYLAAAQSCSAIGRLLLENAGNPSAAFDALCELDDAVLVEATTAGSVNLSQGRAYLNLFQTHNHERDILILGRSSVANADKNRYFNFAGTFEQYAQRVGTGKAHIAWMRSHGAEERFASVVHEKLLFLWLPRIPAIADNAAAAALAEFFTSLYANVAFGLKVDNLSRLVSDFFSHDSASQAARGAAAGSAATAAAEKRLRDMGDSQDDDSQEAAERKRAKQDVENKKNGEKGKRDGGEVAIKKRKQDPQKFKDDSSRGGGTDASAATKRDKGWDESDTKWSVGGKGKEGTAALKAVGGSATAGNIGNGAVFDNELHELDASIMLQCTADGCGALWSGGQKRCTGLETDSVIHVKAMSHWKNACGSGKKGWFSRVVTRGSGGAIEIMEKFQGKTIAGKQWSQMKKVV